MNPDTVRAATDVRPIPAVRLAGSAVPWARRWPPALVLLLAGLGGGCESVEQVSLTARLWNGTGYTFCEPAPNPELAVYRCPAQRDFLVEYNAISERDDQVRRRAYLLEAGQARIDNGQAPPWVRPGQSQDGPPLVTFATTNNYVRLNPDRRSFTLFLTNGTAQAYNLPFYRDDHADITRVALTPLAVAGDVVIVGACGGILALYVLCESHTTIQP